MRSAAGPGVIPPGFNLSIDDAAKLFSPPVHIDLVPALGVFGLFENDTGLGGFIALAEIEIDDKPCLEFYIFFKPGSRSPGIALEGANRLTRLARSSVKHPICTLIYSENERGKRFYSKAGFCFDRRVDLDGMVLELWIWHDPMERTSQMTEYLG